MRWTWWHFAALLLVGVGLTVLSFMLHWPWGGLFLLLPFVFPPLRFGKRGPAAVTKDCAQCGFVTSEAWIEHCPRDGSRLRESAG